MTVSGGKTSAPNNGQEAWSINAGINLPIWLGRRNAAVHEAQRCWCPIARIMKT
ncbi:hypothetical protein GWO43_13555 [candidate division KSB1 bacterium]|nr:hypothetical protein [candidate division KSB1 bacterium]NIR71956.1 hypothetical protein [candidate division KSB1 bacterium]NIS24954.1 hypothetical protein [candidate division KSB1 bacterium]NIT71874.1 hypothetical protein [candidate division KSB1 bacterium]NIU25605.1 hypothetical protein [candidate division KSB1 bacterium]